VNKRIAACICAAVLFAGCTSTGPWLSGGDWVEVPAGTPGSVSVWDEDLGTNVWMIYE
jgi:hypothetical protein